MQDISIGIVYRTIKKILMEQCLAKNVNQRLIIMLFSPLSVQTLLKNSAYFLAINSKLNSVLTIFFDLNFNPLFFLS